MFSVGFGSKNREQKIKQMADYDRTTAIILAAVHFEWMLKRAIMKMGVSPTNSLRQELEDVYRLNGKDGKIGYKEIWAREIECGHQNAALGTVLGKLQKIQDRALKVRGKVIHGNGTVGRREGTEAIELLLGVGEKLRKFAHKSGVDLDTKLTTRKKMISTP